MLTLDQLLLRVRQMRAALASLSTDDLSVVPTLHTVTEDGFKWTFDVGASLSDAEIHNAADLLVANIASMKDHLKKWCKQKNVPFTGDTLLNTHQAAAVVHDLWNARKHAGLDQPPRSGRKPEFRDLRRVMSLSTGTQAGGFAVTTFDPQTGRLIAQTGGGGQVEVCIVGNVVDENGGVLGSFSDLCEQAIAAWELALVNAGVPKVS